MSANGLSRRIRSLISTGEQPRTNHFQNLRQHMKDVSGDGGIMKEVIQPGEGPPIPQNSSVLMHYSAYFEHSREPFETNNHVTYPRLLKLGRDVTLAGLELGLLTMKKGEFSRFLLESQYAYGDLGCPPLIPPAAMILYEVQVLDFLDSGQMDDFTSLSPEEQNAAPLPTLLEVVDTVRSFGNRCFKQSRYENAKDRYKQKYFVMDPMCGQQAVTLLKNREANGDEEKERIRRALLPLYLNLSLTELRLHSPSKALKYGKNVLEMESTNTKALYCSGQAYLDLCEYDSAHNCLVAAQAKKPFDSDINNLLRKVAILQKENLDKEKDMCFKMFRDMRAK